VAEILLFHHAHRQTDGFLAFGDELRAAGHAVHAPDLYDGKTFGDITEGVGYAKQVGFATIIEQGVAVAEGLPAELVYPGFSLGFSRPKCSPKRGPAPRAQYCCTGSCRHRSSGLHGPTAFPFRST
jgi:hypothetical protein